MKVKSRIYMFEGGTKRSPGDIFEVSDERVKQLGDDIEVIKIAKNLGRPPKDKMLKTPTEKK